MKQQCDQAGVLLTPKYVRLLQCLRNSKENVKGFELSLHKALETPFRGDIHHGRDSWKGFGNQKKLGKWCPALLVSVKQMHCRKVCLLLES